MKSFVHQLAFIYISGFGNQIHFIGSAESDGTNQQKSEDCREE